MTWEPADALRRIAFLLERSRAGTYRVKAFRGAAATVQATDPAGAAQPGPALARWPTCPASARRPRP